MKLSAQEEYGLRLLIQIAKKPSGASSSIPELALLEDLTEPHVAKLLMILRKAGYISSIRGQLGGYVMAKPAESINLKDLLEVLGGRLFDEGFCDRHSGLSAHCKHEGDCALHGLWSRVQFAIDSVTEKVTLAELLMRRSELIQLSCRSTDESDSVSFVK